MKTWSDPTPRRARRARASELACILSVLARHARGEVLRAVPERLHLLGRAILRARRLRQCGWREVERELARAHRGEQAALLRAAAESRLLVTLAGRLLTAPAADAVDLEDWFARCAREIECALASGLRVDGELLGCCLFEPGSWPPALRLARAALALDPGPAGRLLVARAGLADGRRAAAERALCALLGGDPPLAVRAGAREALGCACDARGASAAAIEHFERAVALGAGARAEASLLVLAREARDECRAEQAAERLARRGEVRAARALRAVEARRRLLLHIP